MGDANLDTNKWDDSHFLHKNVALSLRSCLDLNGLRVNYIGNTYLADHAQNNGNIAESEIDHVYFSKLVKDDFKIKKMSNGSREHVPIVVNLNQIMKAKLHTRKVTKRSYQCTSETM